MQIINFAHPLTTQHLQQLSELLKVPADGLHVHTVPVQVDVTRPLAPQIAALVDKVSADLGWSAEDWQGKPFIVGLPGLAPAAAVLVAELAGRCGYLPAAYRLAARPNAPTPIFDIVEIIPLQSVRDAARGRRQG